jgi:hypothetical protein
LIGGLTKEWKVYFYESLSHRLTVAVRVIWSDEILSDSEKIEQLKWLNEIQHRVTSKIQVERLERHEWPESEFIAMIHHYVKLAPDIGGLVAEAINKSYEHVENIKS